MEKVCTQCNVEKHNSEFSPYRKGKDGLYPVCKECRNAKIKNNIAELKVCVYYLPEEHYIGITRHIYDRMYCHRKNGKITEGYEILAYFERRVDAHYLETMFHMRGYNGFRRYE